MILSVRASLTAITAAIFIIFLFSCSGEKVEDDKRKGSLTIMANAVSGGMNSQVAEWLQEEIPGIEDELGVDVEFLPAGLNDQDYKARIALDIKAGRGADVIAIDQFWVPEFAGAGFIIELDRFYKNWETREKFFGPVREMGVYRGKVYLVPWNADVRMLFYHREILEKSGVEMPWEPASWEDLIEAGNKIKARFPEVAPIQINAGTVMGEATTMQGFYMVLRGADGRLFDRERQCWITDSGPIRRTAEFYRKVYVDDKLADPELQISPKAREKSFGNFSRGEIAIFAESTWFYTSVLNPSNDSWGIEDRDSNIGWTRMPGGGRAGDPDYVSVSGGDGLVINPSTKDPEMAWRLIEELMELDRQKRLFLKKPFTPTRSDLAELPEVREHEFISLAAAKVMPYTSFRPALPNYPDVSFHVQYLTERIVTGQLSVEDALAEFDEAVRNAVGDENVCDQ